MKIIGLMSGSSLDGVDLALCEFDQQENTLFWKILKSSTCSYSAEWKSRLINLPISSARDLMLADYEIGYLFGEMVWDFAKGQSVDYIASHGHTLFHEPENKMTCQIGNGAAIAQTAGITTINDFRSSDISLGGHGAPLASIVDRDLLTDYAALVNLGGISNVSFTKKGSVFAYDVSPCNQLLNYLAAKCGLEYDKNGEMASRGQSHQGLMDEFLKFEFYKLDHPKSLDNNALQKYFFPVLDGFDLSVMDKMSTAVELIATTLTDELQKELSSTEDVAKVLLTGGGAKNKFLVERIRQLNPNQQIVVPDETLIDFKEALLMAYMGYLRVMGKTNVACSVTGAEKDSISGAIYIAEKNG